MRARWRIVLDATKDEALLAVDLYNQPTRPRRLEGFFVHMHLAWLYLFQAKYQRDRADYHYRQPNGRYDRVDGEKKAWDLAKFAREHWSDSDPVRKNLELTIALRNKIEHRHQDAISLATAGFAQALLLNFEAEINAVFGSEHSLGSFLRFPIFVGTFTRDGAARMAVAQQQLPRETRRLLTDFEAGLNTEIRSDPRFEFRVHLIPRTGPKGSADLALSFLRIDDLTADEREVLTSLGQTGTVIVRDRIRDVVNAGKMKPGAVAKRIEREIPFTFAASTHVKRAARCLRVLPEPNEPPERTNVEYCLYDEPNRAYVYTERFAERIAADCATAEGFRRATGLTAHAKPRAEGAAGS